MAVTRVVVASRGCGQDSDHRTGGCGFLASGGTARRGDRDPLLSARRWSASLLVPQASAWTGRGLHPASPSRSVPMHLRGNWIARPGVCPPPRIPVPRGGRLLLTIEDERFLIVDSLLIGDS